MLSGSRLLRPMLFLFIKGAGLSLYSWIIPAFFFVIIVFFLCDFSNNYCLDSTLMLKLIKNCCNLLYVLPGFYIAALAAIATFKSEILDSELDGAKAFLKSRENGKALERSLTRRRFLCLLFGYLSFLCFVLVLISIAVEILLYKKYDLPTVIAGLSFIFLFIQAMCLSFLGLFYLSDRIHWKNENYIIK